MMMMDIDRMTLPGRNGGFAHECGQLFEHDLQDYDDCQDYRWPITC